MLSCICSSYLSRPTIGISTCRKVININGARGETMRPLGLAQGGLEGKDVNVYGVV
jgi:hypothetical protein